LNGLTATRPEERLSLKKGLALLPNDQQEEKNVNPVYGMPTPVEKIKGYVDFTLLSPVAKKYLLNQLTERLKDISCPALTGFLEIYCNKVEDFYRRTEEETNRVFPDVLLLTREVLWKAERGAVENQEQLLSDLDRILQGECVVENQLKEANPDAWKNRQLWKSNKEKQWHREFLSEQQDKKAEDERQRREAELAEDERRLEQQPRKPQSKGWAKAWSATFFARRTPDQCRELTRTDDFLNFIGFPPRPTYSLRFVAATVLWLICVVPVVIKNIVKLVTELPLKIASDAWGFPFNVLHWLVRAVTSPMINFDASRANKKYRKFLVPASVVFSAVGLFGIGIAMGPLIAAIFPVLGLAFYSSNLGLGGVLSLLGYTATPTLVGSTTLSIIGFTSAMIIDVMREQLLGGSRAFPPQITVHTQKNELGSSLVGPSVTQENLQNSLTDAHVPRPRESSKSFSDLQSLLAESLLSKTFRSSRSVQDEEGDLKEEGGRPAAPNSPSLPGSPMREQSEARVEPQSSSQEPPSLTQYSPGRRRGSSQAS